MDPFSSPPPSGSGLGVSNEVMMGQVKQQLAQAYAEEFFGTVRDKCFSKCVTKPSSSLSGGESSCISRCVERYIEATGIISRAVISSLPR
ncbi:mitochondrial import inner membrane translocase subunit TIM13 [Physcomitrium patens]|uniref:Mitochondrial import inner membrane translocase subunit n=1 Tax=Physcomitrium patens TaxID=3218 RepID=A9T5F8_PHYPA|nr:mitochondrial import inner membrane translocase subunit TIM13-like [Physcomitrium patens]XP_024365025.1 mitochondrial import inner membrane translocase subunit TIM13-like [Physcomitrium patens]PNR27673.1 hypothetical protein PHYPA_029825 [Physcomitrium patens]|eukprot:XP_024365024.1 mitochondrial import inner membrane translocase subunit TIM13-like [Physcomitrella patens]